MSSKLISFTSESVSEGHPDKVADQISDAILDNYLAQDPKAKVAVETLVTKNQVVLAGEVHSTATVDVDSVVRDTIRRIGYTKPEYGFTDACGIINLIHEQSADIRRGVVNEYDDEQQGAGDQGMMFGYATNETETYMPLTHFLATRIMEVLAMVRKKGEHMTYLRPDAKSQVTIMFDNDGKPERIGMIIISTQHDDFSKEQGIEYSPDEVMQSVIDTDMRSLVMQIVKESIKDDNIVSLFEKDSGCYGFRVNPTGRFVVGGPYGDTGLTGRKIIVDTYGGYGAHGGGAFSGKDPSKVDRSAAYMARYIAKNMVAAGVADKMLIQLSYAIGMAEPINVSVNTYGTSHVGDDANIASAIEKMFDLRPYHIIKTLQLEQPIYLDTAAYGHFGRKNEKVQKTFHTPDGDIKKTVELFTWEKLDNVEDIKSYFNL